MKVLLDNCVPMTLGDHLPGHDVRHASTEGMSELMNGRLLQAAADAGFEVLVTVDRNMANQQNLAKLPIAIILLLVTRNSAPGVLPLAPRLRSCLEQRLQKRLFRLGKDES